MKKVALFMLMLSLTACGLMTPRNPTTIKQLLPVGSKLRLTQALVIPPDHAYVYIAYGEVVPFKPFNTVNIYYPYCMFRLDKVSSQARRVEPDTFTVTKIVEFEDYSGQREGGQYASNAKASYRGDVRISGSVGINDGAGPSMIMYATIMSLYSERQPQVKELVCGHWEDQGTVEPLTLEEMKQALGDLIVVEQ
jgi:hypothetical protein